MRTKKNLKINTEYKLVSTDIFYNLDENAYDLFIEDIFGNVYKLTTRNLYVSKIRKRRCKI
ncbi:MAG: hypothetical protein PWQ43_733 [Rikenellaceae bacterium]|nr:hypothetical protein [Rikenellaceae bacterium]